jgi:SnoaL-like domain
LTDTITIAELGFQGFGDTGESTCFNLYDIVDWVTGSSKPVVSESSSSKMKGREKVVESKSNLGFSSMFQMLSSVQDDVSKSEDEKEDESMYGVKSVCSAMSYTGDSSSDASISAGSTHPPSVPPSANALKVLRGYYDAFNNHNIPAAVAYLANDIQVTFPDPKKNWSSAAAAYDRYTTMFRKSPHLKGKFSLLDVSHDHKRTIITVYCHFTCSPSGVNTVREMVYIMEDDLIQIINNKY